MGTTIILHQTQLHLVKTAISTSLTNQSSDTDTPPLPFRNPTALLMHPLSSKETDDDAEVEYSHFTRIDSDPVEQPL